MTLTAYLIRRRDTAADTWLAEAQRARGRWVTTTAERRARRRLTLWDTLLGLWTHNGTRRT